MAILRLRKKLLLARKAWKKFTSNLQTKLHKLQKPKAIGTKKPRNRPSTVFQAFPASVQPKYKRRTIQSAHNTYRVRRRLKKTPAPVYADELFVGPVLKLVEHTRPVSMVACKFVTDKCSTSEKKIKMIDGPTLSGASHEGGKTTLMEADDMWESMGMSSPLTRGIDERAEAFIARFRADMQLQEMKARKC